MPDRPPRGKMIFLSGVIFTVHHCTVWECRRMKVLWHFFFTPKSARLCIICAKSPDKVYSKASPRAFSGAFCGKYSIFSATRCRVVKDAFSAARFPASSTAFSNQTPTQARTALCARLPCRASGICGSRSLSSSVQTRPPPGWSGTTADRCRVLW